MPHKGEIACSFWPAASALYAKGLYRRLGNSFPPPQGSLAFSRLFTAIDGSFRLQPNHAACYQILCRTDVSSVVVTNQKLRSGTVICNPFVFVYCLSAWSLWPGHGRLRGVRCAGRRAVLSGPQLFLLSLSHGRRPARDGRVLSLTLHPYWIGTSRGSRTRSFAHRAAVSFYGAVANQRRGQPSCLLTTPSGFVGRC